MYSIIRAYPGNSDLAEALVEHEDEVRQVIGGITGFKAYYVLKLTRGRARSAFSRPVRARRNRPVRPPRG